MLPIWAAPLLWAALGLTACYLTVAIPALISHLRSRR